MAAYWLRGVDSPLMRKLLLPHTGLLMGIHAVNFRHGFAVVVRASSLHTVRNRCRLEACTTSSQRGMALTSLVIAMVATVLFVVGCASTGPTPDEPQQQFPSDFSIDMAIFAPADLSAIPDDLRPGVFILKPGGAVYIRMGKSAIDARHPPFTGRMSPAEATRVWNVVQDSGLLAPDNTSQVSASSLVGKRFNRSVAALVVTADGKRKWFKVALDTQTPDAATIRSIIAQLSRFGPRP